MKNANISDLAKTGRSVEDIIVLYDDGTIKRLDKGMVVHFKDVDPVSEGVNMTIDLLDTDKRDLVILLTGVLQFGLSTGIIDDIEEEDMDDDE